MKNFYYVVIIWISTIIWWLINYFYHPLMLKYLDINTFAEFESLISLFNILWVLTTWLSLFLVKEISINSSNMSKIKSIFIYSNKSLFTIWVIFYFIYLLFSPIIANFLHFDSYLPIVLIGLIIIFSFQWTVLNAVLQWLKQFNFIALNGVLSSIFKIFCWIFFLFIWFKLYWAISWFLLTAIFWFVISYSYVWFILRKYKVSWSLEDIRSDFKKEFSDIFQFFLIIFLLSIFMNIDIIVAKNLFDSEQVGIYSALSVFSKFLIFLGWAIETVYYPQIIEYKIYNVPKHFFRNSFLLIILLWISSLSFSYYLWPFILDFLKSWLSKYITLFLLVMLYCWVYIFISFYSKILISWKIYKINYIYIASLVFLLLGIYTFWKWNINNFIFTIISFFVFILLITWYIFIKELKKQDKLDQY